jgi:aspartyl-tRNA(Asn)/glutamyl-tRNA(Gln) amidotransferase subunit A
VSEAAWELSAVRLRGLYLAGELSPVEVTRSVLDRIEERNADLGAFITVTPEIALEQARAAERAYREGEDAAPLLGVPVSIKDLTWTRGVRTTFGSLVTADFVPDRDAPVVERLRAAGAVMLGKTNVPEQGWKGDTTNRLIGSTHNPWQPGATAGGSSGGAAAAVAAAAVAAGLGPIAQGSDGAGSIRIPAGFCGVFGLKPTFGTVPNWPPSSTDTLSHVGPIARTAADAALMLGAMAGPDARDLHSLGRPVLDYRAGLGDDLEGIRIAWSPDLGYVDVDPEVARLTAAAAASLAGAGAVVHDLGPAFADPWPVIHTLWAASEAAAYPNGIDAVRDLLDPGRVPVIEAGFELAPGEVAAAALARHTHYRAVDVLFDSADLLATPTLPVPAFPVGQDSPIRHGLQTSYLGWTGFTYPFNLSGHPAATVSCGFVAAGLPVGLQLIGRWHSDALVLRAAAAFERSRLA